MPTTSNSAQTVSYIDVGIKLEVEPQHLDDGVMIKVSLEVNSLGAQATVQNSIAYTVGTRNAQTTLTLKDGETQILAGLISDNNTESTNRVPGIGEIPVLGRLFSNRNTNVEKREVILSITPRIVRRLERPDAAVAEYWSGPETNIRSAAAAVSPGVPGSPAVPAAGVPVFVPSPGRAGAGDESFTARHGVPTIGSRIRSRPMKPAVFQARTSRKPRRRSTGLVLALPASMKLRFMNAPPTAAMPTKAPKIRPSPTAASPKAMSLPKMPSQWLLIMNWM